MIPRSFLVNEANLPFSAPSGLNDLILLMANSIFILTYIKAESADFPTIIELLLLHLHFSSRSDTHS